MKMRRTGLYFIAIGLATSAANADPVENFYRGKTVNIVIGYSTGGGYDLFARTLGRHIGKHIPGNPSIVPQNMPGAGSLKATNYLYNIAPKDGLTFGTFTRGMAMEPLIGTSPTQFDATKFVWIGSGTNEISICATWHTSPVKTWNDLLTTPSTVGGTGPGSDPNIFTAILKNTFGAKLRLVSGYPGTSELSLAVERGEVEGRCGWAWGSLVASRPDWVTDRKLNMIIVLSLEKFDPLPGVPVIYDLAANDRQRQILKLVLSRQVMGRPFAAPPGIPDDRRAALRDAFDATMKDPEFQAEARKARLDIDPVSGAKLNDLVGELYRTPKDVVEEARAAIAE